MAEPPWKRGEQAARAHRQALGLGTGPINIWDEIRRSEVVVVRHGFGSSGPDGLFMKVRDVSAVIVNCDKDPARQRWTAAHELGHSVMHSAGAHDFVVADIDIYSKTSDMETEADAFAAYFLAPDESVVSVWGEVASDPPVPMDVVAAMSRFGLSYTAMIFRLNNSGQISGKAKEFLLSRGANSVNDLKKEFGYDDEAAFPTGPPLPETELVAPSTRLWAASKISDERLAELLRTNVHAAIDRAKLRGVSKEPAETGQDLSDLFDDADDDSPPFE